MEKLEWIDKDEWWCKAITRFGTYTVMKFNGLPLISVLLSGSAFGEFKLVVRGEGKEIFELAKVMAQRDFELRQDSEAGRLGQPVPSVAGDGGGVDSRLRGNDGAGGGEVGNG